MIGYVMLSKRIVYLLLVVAVVDGADVLKLTDENFDSLLAEKQLVLVNFYTAKYVSIEYIGRGQCCCQCKLH